MLWTMIKISDVLDEMNKYLRESNGKIGFHRLMLAARELRDPVRTGEMREAIVEELDGKGGP